MKKFNCPVCDKELIRLEPFENGVYEFWCDHCNVDITITNNAEVEDFAMNEKQKIYDEMCKVLTDWETQGAVDDDLYWMLVKIQNNWETIITASND